MYQDRELVKKHIRTHTERSADDRAAVSVLETFLRSGGRINTNFACDDKWPNIDGTFEFVPNPDVSRRPEQNFVVQIKGTHSFSENNGEVKYSLQSLGFPAYIYDNVTLDPGILFVILNPDERGNERVFWKYMSATLLNSIDFSKNSTTITFDSDEEIKNTDEGVLKFCTRLSKIADQHLFTRQLTDREYSEADVRRIIQDSNEQIVESIDRLEFFNATRDNVSRRILNRLDDLCTATLLLNMLRNGGVNVSLRAAWENALLNIETKYLATFLRSLKYIGNRVPEDGQSERLMLKYYSFLWQIRDFLFKYYGINVLKNLEQFPLNTDKLDQEYYELVAQAIEGWNIKKQVSSKSRFYVQRKQPFFVGRERYFEITLQLAGAHATKFNRITAYTKENISTNYSIQVDYSEISIDLWGVPSEIKVITKWKVSVDPVCLNKLGKILRIPTKLSSQYGEYDALMLFLTRTGINFLDLIDLQDIKFSTLVDIIYSRTNTSQFRDVLQRLRMEFSNTSTRRGRNVVRYLLVSMREETLDGVMPTYFNAKLLCEDLNISKACYPFECNPFVSNLAGQRTNQLGFVQDLINVVGSDRFEVARPYVSLEGKTKQTGEIYCVVDEKQAKAIDEYNKRLDFWEQSRGYSIKVENSLACIESYETTTLSILQALVKLSQAGNKGQLQYNQNYIKQSGVTFTDPLKVQTLKNVFVNSHLLLIYGAAGTGKTTLINYISNLMMGRKKLFLTKTHTALQNLKRRIENPGISSDFISIDSFTKKVSLPDYDIIFVDECSTIDNRVMATFMSKISPTTLLVLAGDIHQIEAIEFGNWFFYAKEIINSRGANVELLSTWRTKDESIKDLWDEVRKKGNLITEKLVINGPFSEEIGPRVFESATEDEVVLCLNYDGKFGLNNMNSYFQNANKAGPAVVWQDWSYKVADPILFVDTVRFSVLYNNLKGRLVDIVRDDEKIVFTIDVDILLTQLDCDRDEIEYVDTIGEKTRIRFPVFSYIDSADGSDDSSFRVKTIIPFQLAYAVSIHKAQGLEYDSVKVVIPNSNSERISHGIFYTAITRAKKKLKIYWSAETMQQIVSGFTEDVSEQISKELITAKLLMLDNGNQH